MTIQSSERGGGSESVCLTLRQLRCLHKLALANRCHLRMRDISYTYEGPFLYSESVRETGRLSDSIDWDCVHNKV